MSRSSRKTNERIVHVRDIKQEILDTSNWDGSSLDHIIASLQRVKEALPENATNVRLSLEDTSGPYEDRRMEFVLAYTRPETELEKEKRLRDKQVNEERERQRAAEDLANILKRHPELALKVMQEVSTPETAQPESPTVQRKRRP